MTIPVVISVAIATALAFSVTVWLFLRRRLQALESRVVAAEAEAATQREEAENAQTLTAQQRRAFLLTCSELRTTTQGIMAGVGAVLGSGSEYGLSIGIRDSLHKTALLTDSLRNQLSELAAIAIASYSPTNGDAVLSDELGFDELIEHCEALAFGLRSEYRGVAFKLNSEHRGDYPSFTTSRSAVFAIVRNLLDNAFKFTAQRAFGTTSEVSGAEVDEAGDSRRSSSAAVSLRIVMDTDAGLLTLDCKDNGPGFGAESKSKIFDEFYRGPQGRGTRGLGTGLTTVKRCCEQLRGVLEISGELGEGVVASVTLPELPSQLHEADFDAEGELRAVQLAAPRVGDVVLRRPVIQGPPPPSWVKLPKSGDERPGDSPLDEMTPGQTNSGSGVVLVAVRGRLNRNLLCQTCEQAGFNTASIADGAALLACVATASPVALLVDLELDDATSDDELVTSLRDYPAIADVPVIALTGYSDEARVTRGLLSGADVCLQKPVSAATLTAHLFALLSRLSAGRSISRRRQLRVSEQRLAQLGVAIDELSELLSQPAGAPSVVFAQSALFAGLHGVGRHLDFGRRRLSTDLCAVTRSVLELLGTRIARAGVEVGVDLPKVPMVVHGERGELRQIVFAVLFFCVLDLERRTQSGSRKMAVELKTNGSWGLLRAHIDGLAPAAELAAELFAWRFAKSDDENDDPEFADANQTKADERLAPISGPTAEKTGDPPGAEAEADLSARFGGESLAANCGVAHYLTHRNEGFLRFDDESAHLCFELGLRLDK